MTPDEIIEVLVETARRSVGDDKMTHPEDIGTRMIIAMEDATTCLGVVWELEQKRGSHG